MTNALYNAINKNTQCQFGMARLIAMSAYQILRAGELVNDNKACVAASIAIHKTGENWNYVKSRARKTLVAAEKNGLSLERPYKIIEDRRFGWHSISLWGIFGSDFVPLHCFLQKRI